MSPEQLSFYHPLKMSSVQATALPRDNCIWIIFIIYLSFSTVLPVSLNLRSLNYAGMDTWNSIQKCDEKIDDENWI